jgi:transcriptional regulator with XRE-family HTH domain
LPIIRLTLTTSKPKDSEYPKELKTVGDHLRKRRLDLGLLQREVGQRIGVCCSTVWNWEKGGREPEINHLPAVIAFLGYELLQGVPSDLAE